MQHVPHVSGAVGDQSAGRWAVALAAAAVFMVGGGFLGSAGSAQAAGESGDHAGSPGRDGQSVTCYTYTSSRADAPICNVVAGNGKDGAPGAVDR